jgi:hypothetical protein
MDKGEWCEVETAITALGLFDEPELPQLTHSICDTCFESMSSVIRQEASGA